MAILPRQLIKSFFERGDKPTQQQFSALIDSMLHFSEDHSQLGLRVYDAGRVYMAGDAVLYNDSLFISLVNTTGAFNSAHWRKILSFGSLTYRGMWNPLSNTPAIADGVGTMGDYYIVSVDGTRMIDGNPTWLASDYVIFNGTKWERAVGFGIDNQSAAEVPYNNTTSGITSTDVQGALDNALGRVSTAESDITALTNDLSNAEVVANKGIANGYAGLEADGKIGTSFLPQSILGATKFKGFWDADTDEITSSDAEINGDTMPAASASNEGWYFIVSVPGTTGIDDIPEWALGDWIISLGTVWKKIDNTDAIASWNGRTGVVVPQSGDYTPSMVGLENVPNVDATSRANHTGTQTASTISDFQTAVSANIDLLANINAVAAINISRRHDFVAPYSYCGKAPSGVTETSAVWTIKRIEVSAAGATTITTATNVAWSNRLTATYS